MVRECLEAEGITPLVFLEEENGCCYCLIEGDGERSFLSYHGAEYLFSRSFMRNIDFSKTDSVYVSGLEIEDPTGSEIIEFVYEHPELELYFAPGPRITHIEKGRVEKLLKRRDSNGKGPVLHLNEREACSFTGKESIQAAAEFLSEKTGNALVITLGEKGCYCYGNSDTCIGPSGCFVPPYPANVVDTTGAGDAHCGAVIACLRKGQTLCEACVTANRIGSAVVGAHGIHYGN
jgi:sugar/nucleoside kinase (ribokinase family)